MKILLTGGTGLLGGRLVPTIIKDGHQIVALTRSASSHCKLKAMGAMPVDGDLESSTPLALPAIDAVVHAAALFRFSPAALLKATETAGAQTFVHISAAGIIMDDAGSPIRNADESASTFPTISPPIWRARHGPSCWFWLPASPAFARSRFARPRSGGRAIRSAAGFPLP